jgi:hypothetical protein
MAEVDDVFQRRSQQIPSTISIPYLKLVTYDLVDVAGFSPEDLTALTRVANAFRVLDQDHR